jgi:eukaryotic-like serine/threonine-protein kinase
MLCGMHDDAGPQDQPTASIQPHRPGGDMLPAAPLSPSGTYERSGDRIGPYKLLQLIGEGGFGSVFMAEQEKPVSRKVALKIIKLGMDTRQVVARFEQERQALAMMDHPNIARVLDAGATETGRPFFVMELVKGDPIVEYCDKNNLSIQDRLELCAQVCNAVQHAHTKGIIHRDIKPSNVLVSTQDGRPHTKVIDFGIAKATASKLTEKTLFTEHRQLIGTPEYMSPEQAEGNLDIDTRTDVYSLGVLLYELLTGTTPFSGKELRSAAYAEIQRIIREVEPPKPSTRLSANTDTIASVAANRRTEPRRLDGIIRGELDWIVMKALEKDRQRRYETANGLAMDIRRYLSGEAVVAAPPSTAYRFKKFIRRNRVMVTGVGSVAVALVAGFGTALWQAREASLQRDAAVLAGQKEAQQRAEAEQQRTRADERAVAAERAEKAERDRADQLKRVSDFQAQMLGQIDTTRAGVDLMTDVRERFVASLEKAGVPEAERATRADSLRQELIRVNATDAAAAMIDRTILKPAISTIDKQFKDDPATDASLRQALADLYYTIGLYDAAFPLQESALATRRRVLGEEHPDTLTSLKRIGILLRDRGMLAEAEPYCREAVEKSRLVLGSEHPDTLFSINSLGLVLQAQGKLAEAEPFYREAVATSRRVLGAEHEQTLTSINNMGFLLYAKDELAEAEPFWREALETSRRVLGEEHPDTLIQLNNMAALLQSQGKFAEAERYYREALDKRRRGQGEAHPDTINAIANMGALFTAQGKLAEAEPYYRDALEKRRRVLGDEHPSTLTSIANMGFLLYAQGKFDEAEPYWREALETRRRVLGEEHPDTLTSVNNMSAVLRAQGKLEEAESYVRAEAELSRRALGEEHPDTLTAINNLGELLRARGEHQDSIDELVAAEPKARKVFTGGDARRLAGLLTILGRARVGLGFDAERFKLAEANLLEAHPIYVAARDRGPTHKDTIECAQALVDLYTAWHAAEPGKGYDAKAAEWKAKLPPAESADAVPAKSEPTSATPPSR